MKIVSVSGIVLYDSEKESMKEIIIDAVRSGANLRCADLRRADLSGAELSGAYLRDADLRCADLRDADLRCADLRVANLSGANLRCADLRGADLRSADLRGADLRGADLSGANLSGAYLRCTDLSDANISGANLRGAYLRCANLRDANLSGAENIPHIPMACPTEGAFTAWKKVNGKLIKLEIPADARRSSATTEKCRCDKAKVISITDIKSNEQISEITNINYCTTLYKVGEMVFPDAFDNDRFNECSNGIHFFVDKQSAINY